MPSVWIDAQGSCFSSYKPQHGFQSYSESTTRQAFGEIGGEMARLVLNCDGVDLVTHKLGNLTTIGRAPLNHIVIDNPAVSAQHAIIGRSADSYRLKDLDSTNGTQVNGVFITDVELKDGDKIRFGSVVAVFAGCCRKG
jgi:hypothetical protein